MKFNYFSSATHSYYISQNCQAVAPLPQGRKVTLLQNPISMNYTPLCMVIILLCWKILLGGYFFDNPSKDYICQLKFSLKINILNYVLYGNFKSVTSLPKYNYLGSSITNCFNCLGSLHLDSGVCS